MKQCKWLCAALLIAVFLSGCQEDDPDNGIDRPDPILAEDGTAVSGTATKMADGWASTPADDFISQYGFQLAAPVAVKLTLVNGYIEVLDPHRPPGIFPDAPWETNPIGTFAMAEAARKIKERNSFDSFDLDDRDDIDVYNMATYSTKAVIIAGRAALEAILAGEVDE